LNFGIYFYLILGGIWTIYHGASWLLFNFHIFCIARRGVLAFTSSSLTRELVLTLHTTNKLREGTFGNFLGLGFLGVLLHTNIYSPKRVSLLLAFVFLLLSRRREGKGLAIQQPIFALSFQFGHLCCLSFSYTPAHPLLLYVHTIVDIWAKRNETVTRSTSYYSRILHAFQRLHPRKISLSTTKISTRSASVHNEPNNLKRPCSETRRIGAMTAFSATVIGEQETVY